MLGERLVECRRRAGMTQTELAVAIGKRYSAPMISMVENGQRGLAFDGAVGAARELNVSLDYLAGLTDTPTPAAELAKCVSAGEQARRLGEQLAQLFLAWRHPRTFGKPGLADDPRQIQELERKIEEVAGELAVLTGERSKKNDDA